MTPARRTGAQRRSDIPAPILAALNRGEIESVNLVEALAIDFEKVARAAVPEAASVARKLKGEGVMVRMRGMGEALRHHPRLDELARHPSDLVRSWACYALVAVPDLKLKTRLRRARPFAVDSHMGVRETAWSAFRPFVGKDLDAGLELLTSWVRSPDQNQRRCAIEATRPCGVWCAHLPELKQAPAKALPLLEPVRADPSRYVQNAVGNWLNDASKSQPDWTVELCARWERESPAKQTAYIVRRGLRTLRKRT